MSLNHRFKLPQNCTSSIHLRRKSNVSTKVIYPSQDDCLFCSRKLKQSYFPKMIVKALYSKFASSQNYYYTRDINDILANNRTKAVIHQKDLITYLEEDEEYLKRYYQIHENSFKMKLLVEYYKFHKDIPRIFMVPTCDVLNRYHDKKRRIEYVRIKKLLKEQEKIENKSIVSDTNIQETGNSNQDSNKKLDQKMMIPIGNVLEGVDWEIKEEVPKSIQLSKMLNHQKTCEVSNSYSLLELNKKLLDMTDMKSELFIEENVNKFHDLSNFLTFMKSKSKDKKKKLLEDLSEIEKEASNCGFFTRNLPMKKNFTNQSEKPKPNIITNKNIFAGVKKLDLSKIKKTDEYVYSLSAKQEEIIPLSSNRKKLAIPGNKVINGWPIQSNILRDETKTQRNPPKENNALLNGLFKIKSERLVYEKTKKNFAEIANEAANKIINKSQNILKKDSSSNLLSSKQKNTNMKTSHNRVNSLYCNANTKSQFQITNKETGSPNIKNPSTVTYNNFFKTKTLLRKENPEDNYNFNKFQPPTKNSLTKKDSNKKISHKYTKSDPNLLLPKMIQGISSNNLNNFNNIQFTATKENFETKVKKIEHSKKNSMNFNIKKENENLKKTSLHSHNIASSNFNQNLKTIQKNPPFYTINQNNILNIYFGDDAKGKFFFEIVLPLFFNNRNKYQD